MANNISYGLLWSFTVVAIPKGAKPMEVASGQSLKVTQSTAYPGSSAPGPIMISSTGNYPTTGAMSTALSAAATAAGVILNADPALTQWQSFNSGQG